MKKKTRIEISIGLLMLMSIILFSQRVMAAPAPVQYVLNRKAPSKTTISSGWGLEPKHVPEFTIFIKDFDSGNGSASIEMPIGDFWERKPDEINQDMVHTASSTVLMEIKPACLVRNRFSSRTTYSGTVPIIIHNRGTATSLFKVNNSWGSFYWDVNESGLHEVKSSADVTYDSLSKKLLISFTLPSEILKGNNSDPKLPQTETIPAKFYTFEFTPDVVKGPISGTNVCTAPAAGPNPNCPQFPDGICPAGPTK